MQPHKAKIAREYFFSNPRKKNKKSPTLLKNKTSFQRTVQTLTDITSIIDIFGHSMRKLVTTHLWIDRRVSSNKVWQKCRFSAPHQHLCWKSPPSPSPKTINWNVVKLVAERFKIRLYCTYVAPIYPFKRLLCAWFFSKIQMQTCH